LEAALTLRPDLLPASLFLGAALLELGHPARAVEPLQKVVAAQPDNLEARRRLADALWSLERFEPAVQQYRELSEQAPQASRAGRYESIFVAAQSLGTAEGLYWLSRAASELAREAFDRLGQLPPSPEATLRRVEILRAQRQPLGLTIEELKKAAAAWPEDLRI